MAMAGGHHHWVYSRRPNHHTLPYSVPQCKWSEVKINDPFPQELFLVIHTTYMYIHTHISVFCSIRFIHIWDVWEQHTTHRECVHDNGTNHKRLQVTMCMQTLNSLVGYTCLCMHTCTYVGDKRALFRVMSRTVNLNYSLMPKPHSFRHGAPSWISWACTCLWD